MGGAAGLSCGRRLPLESLERRQWMPGQPTSASSPPCCCLLILLYSLPPLQATVYVYELVEGQVKVDKLEYSKPQQQRGAVAGGLGQL